VFEFGDDIPEIDWPLFPTDESWCPDDPQMVYLGDGVWMLQSTTAAPVDAAQISSDLPHHPSQAAV
jgi:hypothetical protein